jgi:hypothetical protein
VRHDRHLRLVALVDAIKHRIRERQMTDQPDLELRHHLNAEATVRLTNIFKMMMQLTQTNAPDATKLAELRGFLHSAITKLELGVEKPNGPIEPKPGGPPGDRPDLQGSENP